MKKKIMIAFFTLNLLGFVSCFNCDQYRYYDYTGIEVKIHNPIVALSDSLGFGYTYEGMRYTADTFTLKHFANNAYAFDCDKGYDGAKYLLQRISVTSNKDFDEAHPAGTELNDLISVTAHTKSTGTGEYIYVKGYLSESQPSDVYHYYMYLKARPQVNKMHRFTIEVEKSNGKVYHDTSEEIIWD